MESKTSTSTDDLFLLLENETDISENWNRLSEQMDAPVFHEYLYRLISERNITIRGLSVRSLLSRSFTYQIFSGDRIPGRDIILRIAIALSLSLDETQRLLKLADRGALYPKVKRDSAVIFAISNKYDLYRTDELLTSLGLAALI